MIRVVGTVVMDLISRAAHLPLPGETVVGSSSLRLRVGGKGLNQAVQAAKALRVIGETETAGIVGFEGCIGDDAFGRAALKELESAGVRHSLAVSDKYGTGTGSIHCREADGENCIVVSPGANLEAERRLRFNDSPFVNADIIVGQLELPLMATLRVFQSAKPGALRILNVAPIPFERTKVLSDILALSDIIVANKGEAEVLGLYDPQTRAIHRDLARVQAIVVTLGKHGARVLLPGDSARVIEVPPTKDVAVDAIGAGDCFTGYLAAHLLSKNATLEKCVVEANAAAGKYVSQVKQEWSLREASLG